MESEVRSLRQEVARTQDSLRAATRRCRELVRELDTASTAHERERSIRDQQLARILRALLVLESRLKLEQKSIRQLLLDKDNLIREQQSEIARLRRYTSDYIKPQPPVCCDEDKLDPTGFQEHDSGLSKDIEKLKCEIMTKLSESLSEATEPRRAEEVELEEEEEGPTELGCGGQIRKSHSFAGSDISKASLTSSENTDASIITTTTEGSPSLLSTEGFCEGESSDVSPGSTLNKSNSHRCTPSIVTTDSETEVTTLVLLASEQRQKQPPRSCNGPGVAPTSIPRSESKDDGMDCNYASDEDEEPIYENDLRNLKPPLPPAALDRGNNNNNNNNNGANDNGFNNNLQGRTITRLEAEEPSLEESSGNWYSDPDEDRLNDEILRHSVYRPSSKHNSVLECVNQILLRDMEEEENILSVPRRFKHRGKIVRFQPARLSDIESVGSEMERRNSEEPATHTATPCMITTTDEMTEKEDENENERPLSIDGFETANSEDEYGMRIVPAVDPESGLEEDVDETKARPIVIIEPCIKEDSLNNSNIRRSLGKDGLKLSSPTSLCIDRLEDKTCLQMTGNGLTIAKNLDYEDIESLPEILSPGAKVPPALPPKPQFHSSTLILKKIPSPSFLIDETSRKRQNDPMRATDPSVLGLTTTTTTTTTTNGKSSARSLKFEGTPKRPEVNNLWNNRFNNVRASFQQRQQNATAADLAGSPELGHRPKVTNIVKQFEEFKIEGGAGSPGTSETESPTKRPQMSEAELDDIQQNFEEFNLDECDLSEEPGRPEADGSEALFAAQLANGPTAPVLEANSTCNINNNNNNNNNANNNNNCSGVNNNEDQEVGGSTQATMMSSKGNAASNYDSFLEATGLSNKSILTPSRLLSNHKSMLKPKDVKYKSKIKASAVMERHGISVVASAAGPGVTTATTTLTKHWTGPFV